MNEPAVLRGNGQVVESLGHALRSGEHGLSTAPGLLKRLLTEESWRQFTTKRGEDITPSSFEEFVTTPPLKGLGVPVDLVQRIVADDNVASVALRNALKGNDNIITEQGTSRTYILDRLAREHPDLRQRVDAGELSAGKAAVEAGFQPRRFTVRVTNPAAIAATLRRQLKPDTLRNVIKLLNEE